MFLWLESSVLGESFRLYLSLYVVVVSFSLLVFNDSSLKMKAQPCKIYQRIKLIIPKYVFLCPIDMRMHEQVNGSAIFTLNDENTHARGYRLRLGFLQVGWSVIRSAGLYFMSTII